MTLASGNLQFNWPTNEPGFQVQSTTNLTSQVWLPLGSAVATNGAFYKQSGTASGFDAFFELHYSNP